MMVRLRDKSRHAGHVDTGLAGRPQGLLFSHRVVSPRGLTTGSSLIIVFKEHAIYQLVKNQKNVGLRPDYGTGPRGQAAG